MNIKVIKVSPDELPKVIEIDNGLEAMQEQVGGMIQYIMPFEDEIALVCNEEGKILGLDLNRAITMHNEELGHDEMVDIIAGDFILCYAPYDSEDFLSIPDELIDKYKNMFKKGHDFYYDLDNKLTFSEYDIEKEIEI